MSTEPSLESLGALPLVERVGRIEKLRRVAGEISRGARRVDVSGLRGSSVAFFAEALRERVEAICPEVAAVVLR